jgi:hypothetical protein
MKPRLETGPQTYTYYKAYTTLLPTVIMPHNDSFVTGIPKISSFSSRMNSIMLRMCLETKVLPVSMGAPVGHKTPKRGLKICCHRVWK